MTMLMMNNDVNLLWVIFWIVISAGWSVVSFQWLKQTVESINPTQKDTKSHLGGLLIRRMAVFLVIALLFYLALKTEPIAAVAMAFTITIATWVQVIIYNSKLKKQEERQKEK